MRTLAEWTLPTPSTSRADASSTESERPNFKATLMHWNQKYIVRVESGPLEQVYKLDALDFASADELKARLGEAFAASCERAFERMRAELTVLYSGSR